METKEKNSLLIVDDDTSNLMELIHILQPEYKIYAAKDGLSALRTAKNALPDLILLDIIMPDMNGFSVLAELKKVDSTKSIPIIFMTGLDDENKENEGLALGAVDYILKPFSAETVKLRIAQQIKIIDLQRKLET